MTIPERCDVCGTQLRLDPTFIDPVLAGQGEWLPDGETFHGRDCIFCCPACWVEPTHRR